MFERGFQDLWKNGTMRTWKIWQPETRLRLRLSDQLTRGYSELLTNMILYISLFKLIGHTGCFVYSSYVIISISEIICGTQRVIKKVININISTAFSITYVYIHINTIVHIILILYVLLLMHFLLTAYAYFITIAINSAMQ